MSKINYNLKTTLFVSLVSMGLFFSLPSNFCFAQQSPGVIFENNKGVKSIEQWSDLVKKEIERRQKAGEKMPEPSEDGTTEPLVSIDLLISAQKHFITSLSDEPSSSPLHLNLGLSFDLIQENEKALKEYKVALKKSGNSGELKFLAHFNLARTYGAMGKKDLAFDNYRRALAIKPDSLEAKANIEFLWKGQGKGKGKGKGKNKKPGKPGDDKDDKNEPDPNKEIIQRRKLKKRFKSKELTKDNVRKILDEIQSQEQKIRNKEYNKAGKERPRDKDW